MLKSDNDDLGILWLEETLTRSKTLELMNCLDVYISLHRSEGFGLTIAEAMALGKPVIASKYSGNVDFMSKECAFLIDTPTIKTKQPYGPYPRGTVWGDPDIQQAADGITTLIDGKLSIEIGDKARRHIQEELSPKFISGLMMRLINNRPTQRQDQRVNEELS